MGKAGPSSWLQPLALACHWHDLEMRESRGVPTGKNGQVHFSPQGPRGQVAKCRPAHRNPAHGPPPDQTALVLPVALTSFLG
jgi:hypothetical protein